MDQKNIDTELIDITTGVGSRTQKIDTLQEQLNLYKKRYNLVLQTGLILVGFGLVITILYNIWPDIQRFYYANIKPTILRYWLNVLGIIILVVLAFNLYLFRILFRRIFGIVEGIFGVIVGWYGITRATEDSLATGLLIIIAALYLVGHGFLSHDPFSSEGQIR